MMFRIFRRRKKNRRSAKPPTLESRSQASSRESKPRKRRKKPTFYLSLKRFIKKAALYSAITFTVIFLVFYLSLPNIDKLNEFTKIPSVLVKSEDGQIIGSFGDIYGDYISFEELPRSLIDAVIATEDRNFYHHFGVDPFGLLRATYANIRAKHVVQGGSTITQQVAKNVFLTPERSLTRKFKEMMLAIKLERRFSKEEILSIYLNRVYLGAGNYGVDAAAKRYFDKSARNLSLSESAIMAGLLKAPSRFAPTSNPGRSRDRADQVLLNMQDAGYLTEDQTKKARAELAGNMNGRSRASQSSYYFADWVMDQIPEYIGAITQDIVVTTTLRPDWQLMAEKAMNDVMEKDGTPHLASQSAILSMTPDGAIRVMIGGRSYGASQFNRAAQSLRQPGSSFKLFVYLAGLETGLTPDTIVNDHIISVPIVGGTWWPKNYTNKYLGEITLTEAVTQSINTIAVQVAMTAGLDNVIAMAQRLGINSPIDAVPSVALGATEVSLVEITTAYAHLAAGGNIVYPYGILRIESTRGEPIYQRESSRIGAALSPFIVGEMNQMLMSVIENGTGKAARIGRPVAGKTGTTSDYKDAWFIGYTPDLVTGVWVGNDDNKPMKKVTGGMLPARIWHDYMINATKDMPVKQIPITGSSDMNLPWQSPPSIMYDFQRSPETEQQPQSEDNTHATAPVIPVETPGEPAAAAPAPKGPELGKQFWDKLLKKN